MKLFLVKLHNNNPPILTFGKTRALVGRQIKMFLGPDMVDEVVPISNQDAESQYGYNYKQQARWNMIRSESMDNTSMLSGDNPFLREKMDMKKADMGDVVDDFKKSDAPQFQGKSMVKRRQMAIAAKLQANEEAKEDLKLSVVSEGIDQKVLKQFKAMLKDGEEDSVRLLLQGMPKHTKSMYMSRLGIKENNTVDIRTKVYKETVERLNKSKSVEVLPVNEDDDSHYKMTYTKRIAKDNALHLHVHHTAVDFKGERPNNNPRIKKLVTDSPQHKEMKAKGFSISKYGSHDDHPHHESIHGNKPTITKESVEEDLSPAQKDAREKGRIGPKGEVGKREYGSDKAKRSFHQAQRGVSGKGDNRNTMSVFDRQPKTALQGNKPKGKLPEENIDEKTPIKPVIVDRKQPNLKIPNPNYKKKSLPIQRTNRRSADLHIETKQAPAGTYFTKSGALKKGNPESDGPGGEKLASDPLDKQRKTIVNLKNYPK